MRSQNERGKSEANESDLAAGHRKRVARSRDRLLRILSRSAVAPGVQDIDDVNWIGRIPSVCLRVSAAARGEGAALVSSMTVALPRYASVRRFVPSSRCRSSRARRAGSSVKLRRVFLGFVSAMVDIVSTRKMSTKPDQAHGGYSSRAASVCSIGQPPHCQSAAITRPALSRTSVSV